MIKWECEVCGLPLTLKVVEYSQREFKKSLCIEHQEDERNKRGQVRCEICNKYISDFAQENSQRKYDRNLCFDCQRKEFELKVSKQK